MGGCGFSVNSRNIYINWRRGIGGAYCRRQLPFCRHYLCLLFSFSLQFIFYSSSSSISIGVDDGLGFLLLLPR